MRTKMPRPKASPGRGRRGALLAVSAITAALWLLARPALAAGEAEAPPAPEALFSASPGSGVTLRAPGGRFELNLRARAQIRDTIARTGDEVTNEINVKTIRLNLAGHLLERDLRYRVQLAFGARDFEADNPSPIFDAHLDYVGLRDLNIRVGQFLVPFDRARTTREYALELVDRQSVVRELSLDRDVGLMVSSEDLFGAGGRLGYHLFVGGGEGKNRFGGAKLGPLVIGRFVFRPFGPFDDDQEGDLARTPTPKLALGVAGAYNSRTDRASSTFGTILTLGTYDYAHGAADLVFKWRGFSLLVEGLLRRAFGPTLAATKDGVTKQEPSRAGYGYFAQAGWMLTRHVEIAGRWEQLFAIDGTDPALVKLAGTQGNQAGGGLSVYLNGHLLKAQGDYFAGFGKAGGDIHHQIRLQLDASF
ncbi:MAG: hypothetical protein U0359_10675 [Byssovorax sp.]